MIQINLPAEIKSVEDAEAFLDLLIKNNLAYHPDDRAKDCLENLLPEGQCEQCDRLMAEIFELPGNENNMEMLFDPYKYILDRVL